MTPFGRDSRVQAYLFLSVQGERASMLYEEEGANRERLKYDGAGGSAGGDMTWKPQEGRGGEGQGRTERMRRWW